MESKIKLNNLDGESSLYLKQHSAQPVQWYPYGPEALQLAKDQNKPIFLSIGYSSNHLCHIMAHETFENAQTSQLLNDNFINIKVDKEELPDLDSYYQLACQVMNGKGGWPLNAFLTPEMKPYYIGTFLPQVSQKDIPSFIEVAGSLAKAFSEDFETISKNSEQIVQALSQNPEVKNTVEFEGHYPAAASVLNALKDYQDNENGGFGPGPKFPMYSFMEWSIEHMLEGMIPEEQGKHIIESIEKMMMGGIYDHVRGGIHRYAPGESWQVPNFEKMLYDQAGLLRLLSKASLIYPSPLVFDALIQTLDYLGNEMLSEDGFFFSAQNADSEGVEGLYFTFGKDEFLDSIIDFNEEFADEGDKFLKWFNITEEGNFKHKLSTISLNEECKNDFYSPEGWNQVRGIRQALWETRKMRIPPTTDNKGVASWNFQIISSLIDVIQYCKVTTIQNTAKELLEKSLEPIHKKFLTTDKSGSTRIQTATTREGHFPLFEDYVMFVDMSFRCYELTGHQNYFDNSLRTLEYIMKEFQKDGAFYTRGLSFSENAEYANLHTPIFDQSYRSSLGALISNLRKWSLVHSEIREYLGQMTSMIEVLTHLSLQNPLAFGETLRSLVYPQEAYRRLEVPKSWANNPKFTQFFPNFSVRFAISYIEQEEGNNNWHIYTHQECEVQGTSLDEFAEIFTPVKEDKSE